MRTKKLLSGLVVAAMLAAAPAGAALAQTGHDAHGAHMAPAADTPATTAYKSAMEKMHMDMSSMTYSGDADIDFVRGMIPHHQAAIDMAKAVLAHGKDPEIRKLAEAIVAAQQTEIADMEAWLAKKGAK